MDIQLFLHNPWDPRVQIISPPTGYQGNSPTGRSPRIAWTAARQTVWLDMVAHNDPWYVRLKARATAGDPDANVILYQWTGASGYAQTAWNVIGPAIAPPWTDAGLGGQADEGVITNCWRYDWLYPFLSAAQRQSYLDALNGWGDSISDQVSLFSRTPATLGTYFGLALIDVATAPENPRAGQFLQKIFFDANTSSNKPVSGLDNAVANRASLRNNLKYFWTLAQSGCWVEAPDRAFGQLCYALLAYDGIRTATGADHFPEIANWLPNCARDHLFQLVGTMADAFHWGSRNFGEDNESRLQYRQTFLGGLAGLLEGDSGLGPRLRSLVEELASSGLFSNKAADPFWPFYVLYNAYAPSSSWRSAYGTRMYFDTPGVLYCKSDWATGGTLAVLAAHSGTEFDDLLLVSDFVLWRKGEWALNHARPYHQVQGANYMHVGECYNSMQFRGLSAMYNRGPAGVEYNDGYAFLIGVTSGNYYSPSQANPPPTFLLEHTRSTLFLPASGGTAETFVTYDRTNVLDPAASGITGYGSWEQSRITASQNPASGAVKEWIIHSDHVPTYTSGTITWTTSGNQQVQVTTLLPASQTRTLYNESTFWPDQSSWAVVSAERLYHTRIRPAPSGQWHTFLNVVQVHDGVTLTNTAVSGTAGPTTEGVFLRRPSERDVLVMFSAVTTGRVLTSGYTVQWTAVAVNTDVYLADLSPTKTWSYTVDGGASTPLTPGSAGLGRLTVPGTGAHTLVLTGT